MSTIRTYEEHENLTLTRAEIEALDPIRGEAGQSIRAYCPFHGSENQRSLRIDAVTGRFNCFACEAWGYTEEARQRYRSSVAASVIRPTRPTYQPRPMPTPVRPNLDSLLSAFQTSLSGGPGERFLKERCIPLDLSRGFGVGYSAPGRWPNPYRDWWNGRLVFPETVPDGQVVNLYGRAVGGAGEVPRKDRHDHLPGNKGYFNTPVILRGDGPLFVCEGVFDALSLMAAGYPRTLALLGISGLPWEWLRDVRHIVVALDADDTGQTKARRLAKEAVLRGKQVSLMPIEAYGGHKDVNEAWVAGVLRTEEWAAEKPITPPPCTTMSARVAVPSEPLAEPSPPLEPWQCAICPSCGRTWPWEKAPKDWHCHDCHVELYQPF